MIYKTDFLAKKKEAAAGGRGEVLYKKSGNDPDKASIFGKNTRA